MFIGCFKWLRRGLISPGFETICLRSFVQLVHWARSTSGMTRVGYHGSNLCVGQNYTTTAGVSPCFLFQGSVLGTYF